MNKSIYRLIIFLLTVGYYLISPQIIYAATYYISTTGNDANPGTESQPFASFKQAFSKMVGGDTLIVEDGVYTSQNKMIGYFTFNGSWKSWGPPAGSPGAYTTIKARNYHKVTIDGEGTNNTIMIKTFDNNGNGIIDADEKREYIKIEGIRAINSGSHVIEVENSHDIIFKVISAYNSAPSKYIVVISVSGDNGPSYNVLFEDVWTWGHGRYGIQIWRVHDITVRRAVTRYDSGNYAGQPVSGIVAYYSRNVLIENSISFDQALSDQEQSGFYSTGHFDTDYPNNNNKWLGTIALNNPVVGYASDSDSGTDSNIYRDCVGWDNGSDGLSIIRTTTENTLIENCLLGKNKVDGFFSGNGVSNTTFKHNLIINNSGTGIAGSGTYLEKNYNNSWNNTGGNGDPGPKGISIDPGIKYITRVEPASPKASDGKDIGANIIYRYVDGVLTNQTLWPWPYENWIKEDMCDPDFLLANGRAGADTPKWCTTTKTLTRYIWEYLGNTIPPEIYGAPDTTAPATPTGLMVK